MRNKSTTRHRARRKLEGTAALCDTLNQHLADIGSWYQDQHPEITDQLLLIGSAIEEIRKGILRLRDGI